MFIYDGMKQCHEMNAANFFYDGDFNTKQKSSHKIDTCRRR